MVFYPVKLLIEKVITSLSGINCFGCKIFVKIVNPPLFPGIPGHFFTQLPFSLHTGCSKE